MINITPFRLTEEAIISVGASAKLIKITYTTREKTLVFPKPSFSAMTTGWTN